MHVASSQVKGDVRLVEAIVGEILLDDATFVAATDDKVVELGSIIDDTIDGRTTDEQITIADLTGVAVQDIQIANAVCAELRHAS